MERLANVHPRAILLEEFLLPLGITAYKLSKDCLSISVKWFLRIFDAIYPVRDRTALRLSSSKPARPYISPFLFFNLFTFPSSRPFVQGYRVAFRTASLSWVTPFSNELMALICN